MGARTRGIANNILSDGLDATDGLSGALSSSNITNASVTNVTSTPSIGGGFDKVASDPPSPVEGEIWFNTTSNSVKGYVYAPGSWATGGNMNTRKSGTTTGTNTAALNAFGYDYSGPDASTNKAEEYDGTSWTAVSNGATPRYNTNGGGTQTTSLLVGGLQSSGPAYAVSSAVESWNGSSWTTENGMPSGRWATTTTGDTTALVSSGGYYDLSNNLTNATMEYNGSTWSNGTDYPSIIARAGATGTATAAFYYGGTQNSPGSTKISSTFDYDGTTWTANTNLPVAASSVGGRTGPSTAALMASGYTGTAGPHQTQTMEWDGTSFTILPATQNTTAFGADQSQSGGSTTNAILAGRPPANTLAEVTEEWTGAGVAIKTLG